MSALGHSLRRPATRAATATTTSTASATPSVMASVVKKVIQVGVGMGLLGSSGREFELLASGLDAERATAHASGRG